MTVGGTSTVRAVEAPGFDADAKKILKAYLDAGWTASSSSNSHMILRAPDGVTTTALGGRTNGRTGKNAIAPLNRWLRAREPQDKPKPVVRQPRKETMTTATPAKMPAIKPESKPDDLRARVDAAVAKLTDLGNILAGVQDLVNLITELTAQNDELATRNDEVEAKLALMREALAA